MAPADGKSDTTGDGEDAGARAEAVREVGPLLEIVAAGDGKDAGVRVAAVSAVGAAADDGVSAKLKTCWERKSAV